MVLHLNFLQEHGLVQRYQTLSNVQNTIQYVNKQVSKYHIKDDILNHLDKNWDLMVGHPPCTFMCRNRARLNEIEDRIIDTSLFNTLYNSNIEKICIENPVVKR